MLNFNTDHKALVLTAFGIFLVFSMGVAIFPAYQMEEYLPLPDQPRLSEIEIKGQQIFISEGCVACHTQQVRNIEMDKTWGNRPSVPEDYIYSKKRMGFWRQSPSLLGSERTGPDLSNIGRRQPESAWHLIHLYNPRIVLKESIMPAFPWLFKEVDTASIGVNDVIVAVPKEFFDKPGKVIIASDGALQLVAYLQSLKQIKFPENNAPKFIPLLQKKIEDNQDYAIDNTSNKLNGKILYTNTCSACHQTTGKGIPGAFPSLAGSEIVNNEDPEKMIGIILHGYNGSPNYGSMPGFGNQLTDADIAAIMTYERSSWGNNAPAVSEEQVKQVREFIEKNIENKL